MKSNGFFPSVNLLFSGCLLILTISCQNPSQETINRSWENILSSFELDKNFQIELIAAEPLIADPVDMEIDEYGRMYVVEMHGYPLDISGTGKVILLSDSNGDGRMDKSSVFAEGLILPTGIMRWKKGILITDPPNVLYLEDTSGDGKADYKEIILTGFALSNPQHNVNSPRLGLDNWIYLGHEPAVTTTTYEEKFGDRGNEVYYPNKPNTVKLPENAGGRSVRFRPDSDGLELLSSKTQFGHTGDAWGHRLLVNNNNHIIEEVMTAGYLNRNPYLLVADATQSISDHGNASEVFPITINPEHQLLTDVGVITSACGITAYLGGAFPSEYENVVFVAEPVSNIVHADRLTDKGRGYVASRLYEEKEFLASTDPWFRPVNMYIGPDGALYILDYYRQIIEHPEWMAEDVVQSGALYNGTDKGRIYRITSKGKEPANWTEKRMLGDYSIDQLVEKLADPNIWWRRNAQRLLIDRISGKAPELLFEMTRNQKSALGRLHALWTLEGVHQLSKEVILQALKDPEPGIRENAIKLAELYLNKWPELAGDLLEMKSDKNPKVRFQLLCTLGFVESVSASAARNELLFKDLEDEWVQIAALSAPYSRSIGVLDAVLEDFKPELPAYGSLVQRISSMVGASLEYPTIQMLVKRATSNLPEKNFHWQVPMLNGLSQGLQSKKTLPVVFSELEQSLTHAGFQHASIQVRMASLRILKAIGISDNDASNKMVEKAIEIAEDQNLNIEERVLGIDFLSLRNPKLHEVFLKSLIDPAQPLPLQLAALKALGGIPDETSTHFVLQKWESLTPLLRDEAINSMMASPVRISLLLDAMEKGLIEPGNLGWPRSVRLMSQSDESLRNRARMLINRMEEQTEDIIQDYQTALKLKGSMANGKLVYQQNCAICHQMGNDIGFEFGPDLATLKNRRPENILKDILNPNVSIADGYDLWEVELVNGERFQGIISSETPNAINLRNAGYRDNTISRQNIKSLRVLEISAMPSGLEHNINQQEMADLLAFIRRID